MKEQLLKFGVLYFVCCVTSALAAYIGAMVFSFHFWGGGGDKTYLFTLASAVHLFYFPSHVILDGHLPSQPGWPHGHGPGHWVVASLYWGLLFYLLYRVLRWIEGFLTKRLMRREETHGTNAA